jgi:hypothetical protein
VEGVDAKHVPIDASTKRRSPCRRCAEELPRLDCHYTQDPIDHIMATKNTCFNSPSQRAANGEATMQRRSQGDKTSAGRAKEPGKRQFGYETRRSLKLTHRPNHSAGPATAELEREERPCRPNSGVTRRSRNLMTHALSTRGRAELSSDCRRKHFALVGKRVWARGHVGAWVKRQSAVVPRGTSCSIAAR